MRKNKVNPPLLIRTDPPEVKEVPDNVYGMTKEQRNHIRETVDRLWDKYEKPKKIFPDK